MFCSVLEGASNLWSGQFFVVTGTVSMFFVTRFGTYSPVVCQTLRVLFDRDPDASREADKGINQIYAILSGLMQCELVYATPRSWS